MKDERYPTPLVIDEGHLQVVRAYWARLEMLHAVNDNVTGHYATELTRAVHIHAFATWMMYKAGEDITDMVLENMCNDGHIDVADTLNKYFKHVQEYYVRQHDAMPPVYDPE